MLKEDVFEAAALVFSCCAGLLIGVAMLAYSQPAWIVDSHDGTRFERFATMSQCLEVLESIPYNDDYECVRGGK